MLTLTLLLMQVTFDRAYDDTCMIGPHACVGIQPAMVAFTEPRIGKEFLFRVYSGCGNPPGHEPSPYVLIRSRERHTWAGLDLPLSLEVLGIPECFRYVGDGVTAIRPRSQAERINIPDVPELVGQEFYFQAFFRINDWTSGLYDPDIHPNPPPVRWASTKLMIVKVMPG